VDIISKTRFCCWSLVRTRQTAFMPLLCHFCSNRYGAELVIAWLHWCLY